MAVAAAPHAHPPAARRPKEQIEELKQRQFSPEQIEHQVLKRTAAEPAVDDGLVKDLVSSSFLDSAEFRAVETFIVETRSVRPREAKRSSTTPSR